MDILDPNGVAVDVKEAIATLMQRSAPALIGRLVEEMTKSGILSAEQLQRILPMHYKVRE